MECVVGVKTVLLVRELLHVETVQLRNSLGHHEALLLSEKLG